MSIGTCWAGEYENACNNALIHDCKLVVLVGGAKLPTGYETYAKVSVKELEGYASGDIILALPHKGKMCCERLLNIKGSLDEVNAARAQRGLRPYIYDEGLTIAAIGAAQYRAANLIEGHTSNDFSFVPSGSSASAAGCAAWEQGSGWGSCCTFDDYKYAGAAYSIGRDGRRYMHLYVR
jgi:hypothetical protein